LGRFAGRALCSLVCPLVLAYADEAAGQTERWVFSSLWGQEISISRSFNPDKYALTVADVTDRVAACDARGYRVCFVTTSLSVAIPSEPPGEGDAWKEDGATFWVEAVISSASVDVLGVSAKPLYVIRVDHDLYDELGIQTIRRHRLYYSYRIGLLAFEELDEGENSPVFLASTVPALGAQPASEWTP
jgi:hypothetical protein